MQERFGWPGYFFVAKDWIGRLGFLNAAQIRELDSRGPMIGSHACAHPERMGVTVVETAAGGVEGKHRTTGFDPRPSGQSRFDAGGYYSRRVAEAAAAAGIETLFTSEPTAGLRMVNGCRVPGRYAVERGMGPEWSAGFAAGKLGPHLQRALLWKAKALAKAVGGPPLSAATRGYTEEGLIWLIRSLV